jgi:hypothetical protein
MSTIIERGFSRGTNEDAPIPKRERERERERERGGAA